MGFGVHTLDVCAGKMQCFQAPSPRFLPHPSASWSHTFSLLVFATQFAAFVGNSDRQAGARRLRPLTAGRGLCLFPSHCCWVSDLSSFLRQLQSKRLRLSAQQAPPTPISTSRGKEGESVPQAGVQMEPRPCLRGVGMGWGRLKGDRQGEKEAGGSRRG